MNDNPSKPEFEDVCRALCGAFQGVLTWTWDSRFAAVLSEFAVARKDDICSTLEQYFGSAWDRSNIGNAPDFVRKIEGLFGGLWPGQSLLTTDPRRDALLFCTCWPWSDEKTISLRLGLTHKKRLPKSKKAEEIQQFKDWFGIQ